MDLLYEEILCITPQSWQMGSSKQDFAASELFNDVKMQGPDGNKILLEEMVASHKKKLIT